MTYKKEKLLLLSPSYDWVAGGCVLPVCLLQKRQGSSSLKIYKEEK
jgi:hypothetical protein